MIQINTAQLVAFLIGPMLPLLTGAITRVDAPDSVRAVTLALLSGFVSFGTALVAAANAGIPFDWRSAVMGALGTFVSGVSAHHGLWKHIGISKWLVALPGFIGPIVKTIEEDSNAPS